MTLVCWLSVAMAEFCRRHRSSRALVRDSVPAEQRGLQHLLEGLRGSAETALKISLWRKTSLNTGMLSPPTVPSFLPIGFKFWTLLASPIIT